MDKNLKQYFQNIMDENSEISINEIKNIISENIEHYNDTPFDIFEGLSQEKMQGLLYEEWGKNIVTINPNNFDGNDIPIIRQIKFYINLINENNGIQLTKTGNLPPIIVKNIYSQKFILDYAVENGITKLTKETDVENIVFMKIICGIAGLTKKSKNKIMLTKKTLNLITSNQIFNKIFESAFKKYNWAYFDGFSDERIGQFGNSYSLFLLNKYGKEWKDEDFFADLYFKAFPQFLESDEYYFLQGSYTSRTFGRMLLYFGFIEYEDKNIIKGNIRTTELFNKYIKIGMYVA